MKPTQTKASIVFCHGIWADGSSFFATERGRAGYEEYRQEFSEAHLADGFAKSGN